MLFWIFLTLPNIARMSDCNAVSDDLHNVTSMIGEGAGTLGARPGDHPSAGQGWDGPGQGRKGVAGARISGALALLEIWACIKMFTLPTMQKNIDANFRQFCRDSSL